MNETLKRAAELLREDAEHAKDFQEAYADFSGESLCMKDHDELIKLAGELECMAQIEPVAWRVHPFDYGIGDRGVYALTMRREQVSMWERKGWDVEPLYAAPSEPENHSQKDSIPPSSLECASKRVPRISKVETLEILEQATYRIEHDFALGGAYWRLARILSGYLEGRLSAHDHCTPEFIKRTHGVLYVPATTK